MSHAVRWIYLVLVAATFAAFFVAQALENSPSVIQQVKFPGFFSPNGDGRFDRARFSFMLKEADSVSVAVVDRDGDEVRELLDDRRLGAFERIQPGLPWDGRDDRGRLVADGLYKFRITLREQGRSVVVPRSVRKDTRAPRPRVLSVGPRSDFGPELLPRPGGGPATVRFSAPGRRVRAMLFKTGPRAPRLVLDEALPDGARSWDWDGRVRGRRASAGTYLVAIQSRDQAGNVGTSPPLDARGLPAVTFGARAPGQGGITVRYLALQPPAEPVKARETATFGIDARRKRYTWSIRRIGAARPVKRGRGTRPIVRVQTPGGISGTYLFEVRTRTHSARVPFAVQARRPRAGTRARPRGVLVMLPVITWQGRNSVDEDGDGLPNTLARGVGVRLDRPYAPDGLPVGFATAEAPVLGWLDRTGRRYDVTTDAALLRNRGPALETYRGILIPGDSRWLTGRVRARLRAFARRGGTVVSLGTDSLRRTVGLSSGGRLVRPSAPLGTDLFGSRLKTVAPITTDLENFSDDIGLFATTSGLLSGVRAWEETVAAGREADLVASAVTVNPPGRTVVVGLRFGRGLVIRTGIPGFQTRLTPDQVSAELMARMWTLLGR